MELQCQDLWQPGFQCDACLRQSSIVEKKSLEKDLQRQWSSKINLEEAWVGGEKASGWLRVPGRMYSQLGEYFGVAGKGGSWNREKHLKRQSREGEELMKVKYSDRTSNNSEEYT